MRVAIIGQTLNKNWQHKISGGIQTVERLHVKILEKLGHEVYFIAPKDSEQFSDYANLCCTATDSNEGVSSNLTRAEKAALSKKSAVEIRDWITEIKPDMIINHSFSSSHVRLCAELSAKIPTLCFVHNTSDTAMDIGVIAKVQHYKKLTENGSALVCVSGYQRDTWRTALRKRVASGSESFEFLAESDVDKIYDLYCYPVYVTPQQAQPPEDHFVVISRPDPVKNVHTLLELATQVNPFKLELFIAHPGKLEDNEYYVKKMQPALEKLQRLGHSVKLHHNAGRNLLLKRLMRAVGCFIPCTVEAAPVALLEAGSYGVKSIVFGKKRDGVLGHAAVDLLGADRIQLVDVSGTVQESASALQKAVQSVTADPGDRPKLQQYTELTHSFSARTDNLSQIMETVSSRYTKPKASLMEF